MSGTMKLPGSLQFSTSANDWRNEVELLAKGNTATVCLFIEPDPALRERFDGSTECTQEGHSLNGKTPDAETTISYNRPFAKRVQKCSDAIHISDPIVSRRLYKAGIKQAMLFGN
jgi:hypothetical protein